MAGVLQFPGRAALVLACVLAAFSARSADAPAIHVDASEVGPRPLEDQTRSSVVRDYLRAWQDLSRALDENRADLLDASFVGTVKEKLSDTIQQQKEDGVSSRYRPSRHQIHLVFYSPEGMSVQLVDAIDYELEVVNQGKSLGNEHVRARYVAVLTPAEVRWKVRILEAAPQ
jgi:hypothetical protein